MRLPYLTFALLGLLGVLAWALIEQRLHAAERVSQTREIQLKTISVVDDLVIELDRPLIAHEALVIALSRPLFVQSRSKRDPAPASFATREPVLRVQAQEPESVPEVPPPSLLYVGSMRLGGVTRVLLRDTTGLESWFEVGDRIAEWQIDAVSSGELILRAGSQRLALPMSQARE